MGWDHTATCKALAVCRQVPYTFLFPWFNAVSCKVFKICSKTLRREKTNVCFGLPPKPGPALDHSPFYTVPSMSETPLWCGHYWFAVCCDMATIVLSTRSWCSEQTTAPSGNRTVAPGTCSNALCWTISSTQACWEMPTHSTSNCSSLRGGTSHLGSAITSHPLTTFHCSCSCLPLVPSLLAFS